MLRYSMSRKVSAVLHFPLELVLQLTSDLSPVTTAGFHPVKVEVTVEVSGQLGPSGALLPIKELHLILTTALSQSDSLQSSLATVTQQIWEHISHSIRTRLTQDHSPDLELTSLELGFENGTCFKMSQPASTLTLKYPVSFQHAVEFDLGAHGELLHHGHDAQAEVSLRLDAEAATRFLSLKKAKLDVAMAATGEMIVKAIAESIGAGEFKQELVNVKLLETAKNAFSATVDKLQS